MNLSAFGLASLIGMAAAAYLARHGLPRQVTNLQQHTLLGFSPTGAGAPWQLQGPRGATASIEAGQRLRVDATPALHAAVMAGIGISLFTALTVQEDLRSGRLTRVLPAWKGATSLLRAVPACACTGAEGARAGRSPGHALRWADGRGRLATPRQRGA